MTGSNSASEDEKKRKVPIKEISPLPKNELEDRKRKDAELKLLELRKAWVNKPSAAAQNTMGPIFKSLTVNNYAKKSVKSKP